MSARTTLSSVRAVGARTDDRHWRPSRADIAIATAAAVLAISSAAIIGANSDEPDLSLLAVVVLLVECIPLADRRRRPLLVWAVVGAASAVYGIADWPDPVVPIAAFISLAAVVEHCPRRTALVVWCISAVAALLGLVLPGDSDPLDAWMVVTLLVVAPLLGDQQRARRAYVAELEANVERSNRERERELRTTRLTERAHLARELHDVVAHHVSMIVVQAEAAASVAATSDRSAPSIAAFDAIGMSARRTLAELRTLLDVLHTDEQVSAPTAPQPGVDQIGDLIRGVPADLMTIDLFVEGDRRPLPPAVDLSAYRIVQEGITNVIKHAGARHASVRVSYEPERLAVSVTDDGCGRDHPPSSRGHGLDGLRERVALLDGTFSATPGPAGGFLLSVSLPAPT